MKKPKKLSKNQLKKLKGGLAACNETRCHVGSGVVTCAVQDNSKAECAGNADQTLDIVGPSSPTKTTTKK